MLRDSAAAAERFAAYARSRSSAKTTYGVHSNAAVEISAARAEAALEVTAKPLEHLFGQVLLQRGVQLRELLSLLDRALQQMPFDLVMPSLPVCAVGHVVLSLTVLAVLAAHASDLQFELSRNRLDLAVLRAQQRQLDVYRRARAASAFSRRGGMATKDEGNVGQIRTMARPTDSRLSSRSG